MPKHAHFIVRWKGSNSKTATVALRKINVVYGHEEEWGRRWSTETKIVKVLNMDLCSAIPNQKPQSWSTYKCIVASRSVGKNYQRTKTDKIVRDINLQTLTTST